MSGLLLKVSVAAAGLLLLLCQAFRSIRQALLVMVSASSDIETARVRVFAVVACPPSRLDTGHPNDRGAKVRPGWGATARRERRTVKGDEAVRRNTRHHSPLGTRPGGTTRLSTPKNPPGRRIRASRVPVSSSHAQVRGGTAWIACRRPAETRSPSTAEGHHSARTGV